MMTKGTLASVASGAIAIALGVKITPASRFTLSRTISSCASCLALSGFGPVSSRIRNSMSTPGGSSFWCSFRYRRAPRRARPNFLISLSPSSVYCSNLLPGAVVDRVLEGRPRLHQAPAQGPLVGVVEALARVGLGRRVEDARDLEVFGVEQPSRFLDEVARMLAGILVDRFGGARLGPEHRGKRSPVELVPRRFAARGVRLHQHAHAAFLGDADPGLHQACRRDFAPGERVQALLHGAGERPLDLLALQEPLEHLQGGEVRAVEGAHRDRLPLELLGLVDPRLGVADDRESGHRRAQRHDFRGTMPGLAGLDRALHDAPFAHAELIALALIVE